MYATTSRFDASFFLLFTFTLSPNSMVVYIIYSADEESITKLPPINWIGRFVMKKSKKMHAYVVSAGTRTCVCVQDSKKGTYIKCSEAMKLAVDCSYKPQRH